MSTWSNELPAEPGWYWMRRKGHDDEIVRFARDYPRPGVVFRVRAAGPFLPGNFRDAQWLRIDPPAEAVD